MNREHRKIIERLLLEGKTPKQIMAVHPDITRDTISYIRKILGLPLFKRGRGAGLTIGTLQRIETVKDLLEKGHLKIECAKILNLSRQRIDQFLNPEKHSARGKTFYAVKKGVLVKPKRCAYCDKKKPVQAHHKDYSKPLLVIWLCSKCHGKEHSSPTQQTHNLNNH